MIAYLSPLQLTNVLWASNLTSVVGSLGTQDDTNVAIYGGTIQNVALNNVSLNNATFGTSSIPTGTIAKVAGTSSAGGLVSVNPGANNSVLASTAGSSVTAGNFAIGSQYTITSLGNTTFAGVGGIGATSGTFTGYINNLATPTPGAGTILTVSSGTGLAIGQLLTGAGVTTDTKIIGQISATSWRVNNSQLTGSSGSPVTFTRTDPVFIATGAGSGTGTATLNQWGLATGPFIQQGTGFGQNSNPVKIGWNNSNDLLATVDTTDVGSLLGVGGYGTTWQTFTAPARVENTTYTNSTGRAIMVAIYGGQGPAIYVNGVYLGFNAGGGSDNGVISFIVPWGATYRADSGGATYSNWAELR